MVYDNDTPLTPEIIEKLVPKVEHSNRYVGERGFKIKTGDDIEPTYLFISLLSAGAYAENDRGICTIAQTISKL